MIRSPTTCSIGIVGTGEITRKSHLPVLVNTPNAKIAWIYDRRPECAQALARAYGLRAVDALSPEELPACDVVLLAIPVDARPDYLDTLSSSGTAAFCEKPFALSAAEHARHIERFAPHALGAGFMRRFYRSTMLLRRIVTEGIFGPLLKIDISEGNRSKGSGVDSSFLDDPRLGASRGVLMDLGSHSIDLALYISAATGFEVQSCTKVLDGAVDRKLTAAVRLQTAGNEPARPVELNYGVSWLDRQDNRIQLTFEHTKVWSGLSPAAEVFVGNPESPLDALCVAQQTAGATTYNQAFYLEWQDFLAGLRAERESVVSARSALLTTSLVEALLTARRSDHA
ncbi:MAG: Gfo/Idh/MocA family protein [Steroidobacteraceae bacterium]